MSFYLWRIQLSRKQTKLQKNYVTDCLKNVYIHYRSLIMIQIPRNSPILTERRKTKAHQQKRHKLQLKSLQNQFLN